MTENNSFTRAFLGDLCVRSDGRTITGLAVPWDTPTRVSDGGASYLEAFSRGAFTRTIAERGDRIKFLALHDQRRLPLGRITSLTEDASGLVIEARVSETSAGDEALTLIRDGALDGLSIGFRPVRHVVKDGVTVRTEARLNEVSAVSIPAYDDARILAVRSADQPLLLSARQRLQLLRENLEH
jgi:HK97 family phage prohead protease